MALWLTVLIRFCYQYAPFAVVERIFRFSKPATSVPHWWSRFSLLAGLRLVLITLLAPSLGMVVLLPNHHFFEQARRFWMGMPWEVSAASAFLIYTFSYYWAHRLLHDWQLLWRSHQMHHSPARFDLSLTYYSHPVDVLVILTSMVATVAVCGFQPYHLAALGAADQFITKWLHMRIRTPQWLGYFVFRPEQHGLHHATHDVNFGLIPLWDQVFGTFKNYAQAPVQVGLSQEAQTRFWPMFRLKLF